MQIELGQGCFAANDICLTHNMAVRQRLSFISNLRHESVSAARYGLNKCGTFRPVPQDLTNTQNVLFDNLGIDVSFRPKSFQDLILTYNSARVFDQVAQQIESLGRKRYASSRAPQAMVQRVKA